MIADISLCRGTDCNRKQSCVRFLTEPKDKFQAWLIESVAIPEPSVCRFFAESYEDVTSK
jgi:hypothetical protein